MGSRAQNDSKDKIKAQKLLTFIDRYRTPVTMINNAIIVPDSFLINEVSIEDKINRVYASILPLHPHPSWSRLSPLHGR
jgi:hypothetical protein